MDCFVYDALRDTRVNHKNETTSKQEKYSIQYKAIQKALREARQNCFDYDLDSVIEQNKAMILLFR